jgi:hypothetical protein
MKKKPATMQKRRPVARHYRTVHKAHGLLLIGVWLLVIGGSAAIAINYFRNNHVLTFGTAGITLRVNKVAYDNHGSYPFKAPPGWRFVIVNVSIKNNKSTVFHLAPVVQSYIEDSQHHKYAMAPATIKNPIKAGVVAPQETRSGTLSYLVPKDAKDLNWQFSP